MIDLPTLADHIRVVSTWIDDTPANRSRDPEAALWTRVAKVIEEAGEAVAALIGVTGQNPRKGVTHTINDVRDELLDVAVTALAAVEHIDGNTGSSVPAFLVHVERRHDRLARLLDPRQ